MFHQNTWSAILVVAGMPTQISELMRREKKKKREEEEEEEAKGRRKEEEEDLGGACF
jgi:ribosomal protein L12E/L44/L45/RPP1/RPP2